MRKRPTLIGGMNMINPLTEVTAERLGEATGFFLQAPAGADAVRYFALKPGRSAAPVAELRFRLDGVTYLYRVMHSTQETAVDFSGHFCDGTEETVERPVAGATLRSCSHGLCLYWLDAGVNYTLWADETDDREAILVAAELTRGRSQ